MSENIIGKILKDFKAYPRYLAWWLAITLGLLALMIIIINYSLLSYTLSSDIFNWQEKIKIISRLPLTLRSNFTVFDQISLGVVSLLAGLNFALLLLYFRKRPKIKKAGLGSLGTLAGLVGIGCPACGSVILSTFFGFSATATFMGFLPFKGAEFALLGIIILLWSIISVAKKIYSPAVCATPLKTDKSNSR